MDVRIDSSLITGFDIVVEEVAFDDVAELHVHPRILKSTLALSQAFQEFWQAAFAK